MQSVWCGISYPLGIGTVLQVDMTRQIPIVSLRHQYQIPVVVGHPNAHSFVSGNTNQITTHIDEIPEHRREADICPDRRHIGEYQTRLTVTCTTAVPAMAGRYNISLYQNKQADVTKPRVKNVELFNLIDWCTQDHPNSLAQQIRSNAHMYNLGWVSMKEGVAFSDDWDLYTGTN